MGKKSSEQKYDIFSVLSFVFGLIPIILLFFLIVIPLGIELIAIFFIPISSILAIIMSYRAKNRIMKYEYKDKKLNEWGKRLAIISISILLLIWIFPEIPSVISAKLSKIPQQGKFYDDNGILVGNCVKQTIDRSSRGKNTVTYYYSLERELLGNCTYHPAISSGSLGGYTCSNNIVGKIECRDANGTLREIDFDFWMKNYSWEERGEICSDLKTVPTGIPSSIASTQPRYECKT